MTSTAPEAGAPPADMRHRLRLYLAGESPNSVAALANLRAVLAEHPGLPVDLEIIDVLVDPARALRDRILITPMLVRLDPPPERRVLGNLRDRASLLRALGIEATHG